MTSKQSKPQNTVLCYSVACHIVTTLCDVVLFVEVLAMQQQGIWQC